MAGKDPRVDAYIAQSAEFAKPILKHLRALVHAGCPQAEETMKWSFPHFMYKGMLCSMASFKNHCAFGFWKGALIGKKFNLAANALEPSMGQFGRITSLKYLPKETVLRKYLREAMALNDAGIQPPSRSKPKDKKQLDVPAYFTAALKKNQKAYRTFSDFSYTNQKDYLDWVTEAKNEETRKQRLETALAWMAEGKVRNWKYVKKN